MITLIVRTENHTYCQVEHGLTSPPTQYRLYGRRIVKSLVQAYHKSFLSASYTTYRCPVHSVCSMLSESLRVRDGLLKLPDCFTHSD